jgi:hypothetical protein
MDPGYQTILSWAIKNIQHANIKGATTIGGIFEIYAVKIV